MHAGYSQSLLPMMFEKKIRKKKNSKRVRKKRSGISWVVAVSNVDHLTFILCIIS